MMRRKIYLLTIPVVCLFSCKVSESTVTGKYIDKRTNDTLELAGDKTYEFEQTLNFGRGWNTGNWTLIDKSVSFSNTKPLPIVGYRLAITKIGESKDPLELRFVLARSSKQLLLNDVVVFNKKARLNESFELIGNRVLVSNHAFDSISIKTPYFPALGFNKNKFEINSIYEIAITPAERLYELDKVSFKYKSGQLVNQSENIRYRKISGGR